MGIWGLGFVSFKAFRVFTAESPPELLHLKVHGWLQVELLGTVNKAAASEYF